ncbi:thermostable alkaline protease [Scenedesmus sp. PABB004]|nr:thermostable alkaline protease [Scenedesmus sp. PABB004]
MARWWPLVCALLLLSTAAAAGEGATGDLETLRVRPGGAQQPATRGKVPAGPASQAAADDQLVAQSRIPGRYVVLFDNVEAGCDVPTATARLAAHVQGVLAAGAGARGAAAAQPLSALLAVERALGPEAVPDAQQPQARAAAAAAMEGGVGAAAAAPRCASRAARRAQRGVVVRLLAQEAELVGAMRSASVVRAVLPDRLVGTASRTLRQSGGEDAGGERGAAVANPAQTRAPSNPGAQACAQPAALGAGVPSSLTGSITWPGCATKDTQLLWLGSRCGDGLSTVQYNMVVAVFRSNGSLARAGGKDCVQPRRRGAAQAAWNRQWLGSGCGMVPSLAPDLPISVCSAAPAAGCLTALDAPAALGATLVLRAPVACAGEVATSLTYTGVPCGPGGGLVSWTRAVTPRGCVLTPSSPAVRGKPKALSDVFGSCGVPPGAATAAPPSTVCPPPPVDCVGSWGPWGACSVTCGAGAQTSTFTVTVKAANGGEDCEALHGATRAQTCTNAPCAPLFDIPKLPRAPVLADQIMPSGARRIEAARDDGSGGGALVVDIDGLPTERQVLVGIVDSGIDSRHPDLNYAGGQSFVQASATHPNDTSDPGVDHYGHGTHVAGIVGALNNGLGTVGIAPGTGLFSLKVLDGDGRGTLSGVLSAVQWAAAQGRSLGIHVLNLSLAAYIDPSSEDYDATRAYICGVMQEASDGGIAVVIAAGNYASDLHAYLPANCPCVASVTAVDDDGSEPASYTNWLPEGQRNVDHFLLAAPGTGIFSTMSYEKDITGFQTLSGTSMAAPHVAAVAASCVMSGLCNAGTGLEQLRLLEGAAKAKRDAQPGYGFAGDAESTQFGKFYGFLTWDGF